MVLRLKLARVDSKKGVSQVVTTVLVILITITAASAVIAFVVPFVMNTLAGSTDCLGTENMLQFQEIVEVDGVEERLNYMDLSYTSVFTRYSVLVKNLGSDSDYKEKELDGLILVFENNDGQTITQKIEDGITPSLTDFRFLYKTNFDGSTIRLDPGEIPSKGSSKRYVLDKIGPSTEDNAHYKVSVIPIIKDHGACQKTDEINLRFIDI